MKGADRYYDIFKGKSQQIGRLYLQIHSHARGKCFEILLLPEGTKAGEDGWRKDAIEVYGMTGGQRGWTESYGWLHKGKWQEDFAEIVEAKEAEIAAAVAERKEIEGVKAAEDRSKVNNLLSSYA